MQTMGTGQSSPDNIADRVMRYLKSLRDLLGVAIYDWSRFQRACAEPVTRGASPPRGWTSLCNRIEHLTPNPTGPGVQCDWQWGTELHASHVMPSLGRQLMDVALRDWPIHFADTPSVSNGPRISFIFAHGGRDRLPQLRRTIRSVYAQQDVSAECVVVDQSEEPVLSELPSGTTYMHLTKTAVARGWHKSWAYNVGARAATGDILVFHDGDICVPQRYGVEVARTLQQDGYDVASIQRFLFYLDPSGTAEVERRDRFGSQLVPERVYQNWKGGTIAIRRDAFFAVGGFDEGFVDWGGEDDEFFDRCRQSLRHCRFGYLPFVHLWHRPQPDRKATDNVNISQIMPWRMALPVEERRQELSTRRFGDATGPDPKVSYKAGWADVANVVEGT